MMTVKQIADKVGVSKTTVTRYLKRMENTIGTEYIKHNTSTDELGRMVISEELAEKLQETILKQKELQQGTTYTATPVSHTATADNTGVSERSETGGNNTAAQCYTGLQQGATSEIVNTLNRLIETQQAQIDQLNRTIEQYQQDKDDLKKQIETLSVLLSQQQQLHQTLQVKLLETEAEADVETEKNKKRGLFGIFKKKENNKG